MLQGHPAQARAPGPWPEDKEQLQDAQGEEGFRCQEEVVFLVRGITSPHCYVFYLLFRFSCTALQHYRSVLVPFFKFFVLSYIELWSVETCSAAANLYIAMESLLLNALTLFFLPSTLHACLFCDTRNHFLDKRIQWTQLRDFWKNSRPPPRVEGSCGHLGLAVAASRLRSIDSAR